jgi:hypothetical protein
MARLEFAGSAFHRRVIADRRAAMANRLAKNATHRAVEQRNRLRRKFARSREGMNARRKERFVAINVAEPAQAVLIHQERLDLPSASQDFPKAGQRNLQRVGSQRRQWKSACFPLIPNAAESPRIAKANLPLTAVQLQEEMGVHKLRRIDGENLNAPGHSQMTDELPAGTQLDCDALALAMNRCNRLAAQLAQIGAGGMAHVGGLRNANFANDGADDFRPQARRDRLDFRQLRHLHHCRRTMRPVVLSPFASRRRK